MTELDWDPSQLDLAPEDDDQWFDAVHDMEGDPFAHLFDDVGITITVSWFSPLFFGILDCCTCAAQNHVMAPEADSSSMPYTTPVTVTAMEQDYQIL